MSNDIIEEENTVVFNNAWKNTILWVLGLLCPVILVSTKDICTRCSFLIGIWLIGIIVYILFDRLNNKIDEKQKKQALEVDQTGLVKDKQNGA